MIISFISSKINLSLWVISNFVLFVIRLTFFGHSNIGDYCIYQNTSQLKISKVCEVVVCQKVVESCFLSLFSSHFEIVVTVGAYNLFSDVVRAK